MRSALTRLSGYALFLLVTLATIARSQNTDPMIAPTAEGNSCLDSRSRSDGTSLIERSFQMDLVPLANQILRESLDPALASSEEKRGLWVSGDVTNALTRLAWIVGPENTRLLSLERDGRVRLSAAALARAAGVAHRANGETSVLMAAYIAENEGLALLVQLTASTHRYLLHISQQAPTAGGPLGVRSALNLDNRYDSRINPRRPNGVKLNYERPAAGFDSLVAINPTVRWLNLQTGRVVPTGSLTFHELAEAYAKVDLGVEYLGQGSRRGAHDIALDREERLKSQRPFSKVIGTCGENRILTRREDAP